MYVLCSLAVLALHSLFESWKGSKPSRSPEAAAALGGSGARSKRRGRVQVSRESSVLILCKREGRQKVRSHFWFF